jgi:broad specificity phosphatase PhoE
MVIKIKIMRHAERLDFTEPLKWAIYFGSYWNDSPLTNNGHLNALKKGEELKNENFNPKYIYVSPYLRTITTATRIKEHLYNSQLIIEPLLSEYQSITKHTINLFPNGIPTTFNGEQTPFTYPETYNNFKERVMFIFNKIVENKSDTLIVTHGEFLKVFIVLMQSFNINLNCSVDYLTTISFDYDTDKNQIISQTISII